MPRHRSERGGADVVTPFSESRESKKVVSVTNFSTSSKLRLNRTPRSSLNGKPSTAQVTAFSTNSPMSPHGATFLCRSAGRKRKSRTPTPSKRGNVQAALIQYPRSPESRARHNCCLVNRRRPTCGPDQKLNKAKVYAHLHYGSDLSAASKALVTAMPSDSRRSLSKPAKRRGIRSKASTTGNMANPVQSRRTTATRPVMLANTP
jgi:hypothetical protein